MDAMHTEHAQCFCLQTVLKRLGPFVAFYCYCKIMLISISCTVVAS